ncbi:MAG: hypothetical protein PHW02_06210 [bacterium]|nr:hypothetical protein [bacterium]
MEKTILSEIADIFTGMVLPKKSLMLQAKSPFSKNSLREYRIISIADVSDRGEISRELETMTFEDSMRIKKYSVKYDDIIVSSRGTRIKSALVGPSVRDNTLISSNLICVRILEREDFPPELINFFMRSQFGESSLRRISNAPSGAVNLNVKTLGSFRVPNFSREEAERIMEAVRTMNEIENLMMEQRSVFEIFKKSAEEKFLRKYEDKPE